MRAGLLTEKVQFYHPVIVKTETGSESTIYEPSFSCRAYVQQQGGNQIDENGDVFFTHSVTFNIRRFYQFNELYHIRWKNHNYKINYIEFQPHSQSWVINTELINDFEIEK